MKVLRGVLASAKGRTIVVASVILVSGLAATFAARMLSERMIAADMQRRFSADAQVWARELTKGSAAALALAKTILNQSYESSAEQIFRQGSVAQGLCYTTAAHRESVLAFLSKSSAKN